MFHVETQSQPSLRLRLIWNETDSENKTLGPYNTQDNTRFSSVPANYGQKVLEWSTIKINPTRPIVSLRQVAQKWTLCPGRLRRSFKSMAIFLSRYVVDGRFNISFHFSCCCLLSFLFLTGCPCNTHHSRLIVHIFQHILLLSKRQMSSLSLTISHTLTNATSTSHRIHQDWTDFFVSAKSLVHCKYLFGNGCRETLCPRFYNSTFLLITGNFRTEIFSNEYGMT